MASADAVLNVRTELGATVVRPGETLVLCTPETPSAQQRAEMKAHIERMLPGVHVVILVGVSQALVYEPDEIRAADT